MIRHKICMLGAFAVGKTSLVRRFVERLFSPEYHTTVGVRIDKARVTVGDREVALLLWDLHGDDDFQEVRSSYLRGASGCVLVADGTRPHTLDRALALHQRVLDEVGDIPRVLLLNKADLEPEWELDPTRIEQARRLGLDPRRTSALSGDGVGQAFTELAARLVAVP